MTTTTKTFAEVHADALVAARKAGLEYYNNVLGGVDRYACGFAWVRLPEVKLNTKVGKQIAACGFKKSYNKGVELWNPSGLHCQNIDAKEAGANAYAKVLRENGYLCYSESRLD